MKIISCVAFPHVAINNTPQKNFSTNYVFSKLISITSLKQGVCCTMTLPFTLKSILMQKKNYKNSNITP